MKKFFILFLFVLSLIHFGCGLGGTDSGNPDTATGSDEETACADANGIWIQFYSECTYGCNCLTGGIACICVEPSSADEGCSCGEGMCWDSETQTCEAI